MKTIALSLALSVCGLALDLPPAGDVLRDTGKAVEAFWTDFSSVNCTETVSQAKLNEDGKAIYKKEAAFDYLVLMRQVDGDLLVEESRVEKTPAGKKEPVPLLVTSGFSTLLLVFHPRYQHSYEYSAPVRDDLNGRQVLRIDFRQVTNAQSPSALRLRKRDYPLEWRGRAWIDPQSWAILKIDAELNGNAEDLGLQALNAEVLYTPVGFGDGGPPHWLPQVATIEARTGLQHWKNVHRFTDYKHFTVETVTTTEMPKEGGLP